MLEDKYIQYFNNIADRYNDENKKSYWRLCDDLLLYIMTKLIDKDVFSFLDLGCGTGAWTNIVLSNFNSYGDVYDISEHMLNICKLQLNKYKDRVNFIQDDILNIDESKYSVDIVFMMYVLMFNKEQENMLKKVSRLLKSGGKAYFIIENKYNALSVNLINNNLNEMRDIIYNGTGKITSGVPSLKYNTVEDIKRMCFNANLTIKNIFGFPIITPIGIKHSNECEYIKLKQILDDNEMYNFILRIEKELVLKEDNINRGKYILFEVEYCA